MIILTVLWLIGWMFTGGITGHSKNKDFDKKWIIFAISSLIIWPVLLGEYFQDE